MYSPHTGGILAWLYPDADEFDYTLSSVPGGVLIESWNTANLGTQPSEAAVAAQEIPWRLNTKWKAEKNLREKKKAEAELNNKLKDSSSPEDVQRKIDAINTLRG